jgi:hypothetical protein
MSPVSRGRKAKRGRGRSTPTPSDIYLPMVRAFQPLVTVDDPLDAELLASDLAGSWWQSVVSDDDPEDLIGLGAVQFAIDRGTAPALALLHALAAVGGSAELRQAAAEGAAELAERGVGDPPWAARIGRVEVGDCWQFTDVYGDQASVYCEFGYGPDRHAMLTLLELDPVVGWVKDVFIVDQPDEAFADLRARAAEEADLATLDRIDPAVARRLIEDGVAEVDGTWQPEVGDTFREYRALALARCRALPGPVPAPSEPDDIPEEDRTALVAEFLASADARELPDTRATRSCVRRIVDFGADADGGRPLRISPIKVERFVHGWLPRRIVLTGDEREAMPAVFLAWTRYAALRSRLPEGAVNEVVEVAEECCGHLVEVYDDPASGSVVKLYLTGVEADTVEDLQEVLDRRRFAMPYFGTQIGDEDYPRLNPADPDERSLLVEGEHPEWHDVLRDPSFDGEVDGVSPRLHLAMHEIVTNQLWDDDPPEAWQAARRLLAAGAERHDVLHQLGGVAMQHLYAALTTGEQVDLAAYREALNSL